MIAMKSKHAAISWQRVTLEYTVFMPHHLELSGRAHLALDCSIDHPFPSQTGD